MFSYKYLIGFIMEPTEDSFIPSWPYSRRASTFLSISTSFTSSATDRIFLGLWPRPQAFSVGAERFVHIVENLQM